MKIMFVGDLSLGEYYTSFGNGPGTLQEQEACFPTSWRFLKQRTVWWAISKHPLQT